MIPTIETIIEDLLTVKSFDEWFKNLAEEEWQDLQFYYKELCGRKLTALQIYFKEHGLPNDSVIKGF